MAEFRTEGILSIRVDESSLRSARSDVVDRLGSVPIGVEPETGGMVDQIASDLSDSDPVGVDIEPQTEGFADTISSQIGSVDVGAEIQASGSDTLADANSGVGGMRTDGLGEGVGELQSVVGTIAETAQESHERLVEIRDILDNGNLGQGGQGAGGGGGGLLGGLGGLGGFGGGAIGSLLGGGAKRAGAAAAAHPYVTGGLAGLLGAGVLDKLGIDKQIRGVGQGVGRSLRGNPIGDAITGGAQFLPGAGVGAALPEFGGGLIDLFTLQNPLDDFQEGIGKFSTIMGRRARIIENLAGEAAQFVPIGQDPGKDPVRQDLVGDPNPSGAGGVTASIAKARSVTGTLNAFNNIELPGSAGVSVGGGGVSAKEATENMNFGLTRAMFADEGAQMTTRSATNPFGGNTRMRSSPYRERPPKARAKKEVKVNPQISINVTANHLREIERQIDQQTDRAKREAKEEVRREFERALR